MALRSASTSIAFRWLIAVTTMATFGLIVLGGVVRATGSGDACPDWPRCHGELIPPLQTNVLIEFSHRLAASFVGLLIVATALAAWRWRHSAPVIAWGAIAAVVMVIAQAGLGGMTVLHELPANMVTAHLALGTVLLATLLVVSVAAVDPPPAESVERRRSAASFRNLAFIAAFAVFGLMLSGSYVSGSGAGLAFRDWPLFNGGLLPDGGRLAMIHASHRLLAAAVGLLIVYLAWRAWRDQRWQRAVLLGTLAAAILYTAQVFVGAANIWTLLRAPASATHLALAVAVWAILIGVGLIAHGAAQPATHHQREGAIELPGRLTEQAAGTLSTSGPS